MYPVKLENEAKYAPRLFLPYLNAANRKSLGKCLKQSINFSLKSEDFIEKEERLVIINYNGEVVYTYPFLLTNSCPMQTDNFPFDSQTCNIRVSSGSYPSQYVQFVHINETDTAPAYVRKFKNLHNFTK